MRKVKRKARATVVKVHSLGIKSTRDAVALRRANAKVRRAINKANAKYKRADAELSIALNQWDEVVDTLRRNGCNMHALAVLARG